MKAVRIHEFGGSDKIKIENAERPSLRRHEVLVRIRAAGVNPVDWKIREGLRKKEFPSPFPLTLGQDFAGEAIQVGDEAIGFRLGERVFGFAPGAYAEYAVVAFQALAHMPLKLDFIDAAAVPTPALTAWQMVNEFAHVREGQTVLVHGAAGAVGAFAVQLAKLRKARVIGTASAESASELRALGIDQVIDYRSERFEARVHEVDAVLDCVGGEALRRSYAVVRKGGVIVNTTHEADPDEAQKHGIRAVQFMMERNGRKLGQIAALIDQGLLKTRVSRVFPLESAREAQDLNQQGKSHGKVILQVA